jgi:hypothetical protein
MEFAPMAALPAFAGGVALAARRRRIFQIGLDANSGAGRPRRSAAMGDARSSDQAVAGP